MPCLQETERESSLRRASGSQRSEGRERTGGVGQLGLAGATLTLWHLYTTPTQSTQHVWDDVVFDLVLGEPGEHRQQPQHNGFELGRGAPVEEGRLQRDAGTAILWLAQSQCTACAAGRRMLRRESRALNWRAQQHTPGIVVGPPLGNPQGWASSC